MDKLLKRTLALLLISGLVVLLAVLFGQPPKAPHSGAAETPQVGIHGEADYHPPP